MKFHSQMFSFNEYSSGEGFWNLRGVPEPRGLIPGSGGGSSLQFSFGIEPLSGERLGTVRGC